MTDKLYWDTISGSPFYEVAQPWMKDYVYNAEWKVLCKRVWLDKCGTDPRKEDAR